MSGPEPKEYQSDAIVKLANALTKLLGVSESKDRLVLFKAPTGSGKTLTTGYALGLTHDRPGNPPFIVLWLSPGKGNLHKQSAKALNNLLSNSSLRVKLLDTRDDIVANATPESGDVFVVNWEKLRSERDGEWSNRMLRPGETANLFTLLQNATQRGLDLVVVIDESHTQLDGPQTSKLMLAIRNFRPFIQLEMSATPASKLDEELRDEGIHHAVVIPFRKVEEAGMVRRSVMLNPNFEDVQVHHPGDALDVQVLWAAWERLESLTHDYESSGSNIKPLLLIQYPDGAEAAPRAEVVEKFLRERGLEANKTYATWLTEEHSPDLDLIAQPSSAYRALIFKQAIATGWDCPRAQVLVQFRKPGSETFQIQTLGRLMRTPEQMHYEDETLNVAYVYSDLAGVTVKITTDEPDFALRDLTITRGPHYPGVGLRLRSVFQPRRREFHYPTTKSLEPALYNALNSKVKPILTDAPLRETRSDVLVDGSLSIRELATSGGAQFDGDFLDGLLSDQFVQALFDQLLTSRIGPYRSREQSRSRIKTVLIKWFQSERSWQPDEIQHFVLKHSSTVCEAIDAACHIASADDEAKAIADARSKRRVTDDWEIPPTELVASTTWTEPEAKGTLFVPPLVPTDRSKPELRFEKWLGREFAAGRIAWWWKNGFRDEKYLGIPYVMVTPGSSTTSEEITYPDYLVLANSGAIWVIEVKDIGDPDGGIGGVTSCKAIGLQTWATQMNMRQDDYQQLQDLPNVNAAIAVPVDDGSGGVVVKVGSPNTWTEPTPANHSTGNGWGTLDLGVSPPS